MKTITKTEDLGLLTKDELSLIAYKLFSKRLTGKKSVFIYDLKRELLNYGIAAYNIELINMILTSNYKESKETIKSEHILMLKYLSTYEKFLYKYLLGYEKLYEDKKHKIEKYLLDNEYTFNDQMNTKCDKRICERDYSLIIPSTGFKKLTQLRENTLICHYCGKHYKENTNDGFCHNCTGSEFLEEKDYKLLELFPISQKWKNKKYSSIPLKLIEEIKEKRLATKKANIIKEIQDNKKQLIKKIKEINKEGEVLQYLLNNQDFALLHGIYIFYNHINTLSFKFRSEKMTKSLINLVCKNKKKMEKDLNIKVEL